jgi:hypothetical protein
MKKALIAITLSSVLSACTTMNTAKDETIKLGQKMDVVEKPKSIEPASEKPIDMQTASIASNIPVWFLKTPNQEGYIFGSGTAKSRDLEMAKEKALTVAQGKIAEAVGGKVTKQTKIYKSEAGSNVIQNSNTLIKKLTSNIDFTGTEVREVVVNLEPNGFYRTYVLVALPLGENNQVLKLQMDSAMTREILESQKNEIKELEKTESQPATPNKLLGEKVGSVQVVPLEPRVIASLPHESIENQEIKNKVNDMIANNPKTVVITETVR